MPAPDRTRARDPPAFPDEGGRARMRQVVRRRVPLTLALALVAPLTAGCAGQLVAGQASPGEGEPVDVAADAFPITGVSDDPVSTSSARNALTDLNAFWLVPIPSSSATTSPR